MGPARMKTGLVGWPVLIGLEGTGLDWIDGTAGRAKNYGTVLDSTGLGWNSLG
jgi:hypothetical protein